MSKLCQPPYRAKEAPFCSRQTSAFSSAVLLQTRGQLREAVWNRVTSTRLTVDLLFLPTKVAALIRTAVQLGGRHRHGIGQGQQGREELHCFRTDFGTYQKDEVRLSTRR